MIDCRADQTPVRRQGDRPTCVGFAVSAAHEWMAGDQVVRSVEDALWAGHQEGGSPWREETSVALALAGLSGHGHATEAAWPYGDPPWPADRPAAALEAANRATPGAWRALGSVSIATIEAELLAGNAVILTVRVVYPAWREPSGDIDAEANLKTPANHAVLAVGLLDSPTRLVVKNSWGPAWGDHGYGYMSERYVEHYGLAAHVLEG